MKSQGLPVNFLVKFILGFVIFGLGVIFIWSIFDDGVRSLMIPSQEIDKRIQALNCRPTEPLCVGTNTLNIRSGERILIDVKVFNNFDSPINYLSKVYIVDEGGTIISSPEAPNANMEVRPAQFPFTVNPKSNYDYSLLLTTTRSVPRGAYSIRLILVPDSGLSNQTRRINVFVN